MSTTHTLDTADHCELCTTEGGERLWSNALCRIVQVDDPHYPGFCRVILNRHRVEMSDLDKEEQSALMHVVFTTESVVRQICTPDKINLACLGNMVAHVHWHIIPRWKNDRCFPKPIWGTACNENSSIVLSVTPAQLTQQLKTALCRLLGPSNVPDSKNAMLE